MSQTVNAKIRSAHARKLARQFEELADGVRDRVDIRIEGVLMTAGAVGPVVATIAFTQKEDS